MDNEFAKFAKRHKKKIFDAIKVMYIAKIVKLYPPKADVQPLARNYDGTARTEVFNCNFIFSPMSAYVDHEGKQKLQYKLDYKKGDHVLVGVIDYDTNFYNVHKGLFNIDKKPPHSINDSFILGKVAAKGDFKYGTSH